MKSKYRIITCIHCGHEFPTAMTRTPRCTRCRAHTPTEPKRKPGRPTLPRLVTRNGESVTITKAYTIHNECQIDLYDYIADRGGFPATVGGVECADYNAVADVLDYWFKCGVISAS